MDSLKIYQTAKQGTASGRGPSYWATPMLCGRKAYLQETEKEAFDADRQSDAMRTGSFYHYLHETWQRGSISPDTCIDTSVVQDPAWTEAVRLFHFISSMRPKDYYGVTLGVEFKLPVTPFHKTQVEEFFGIYGDDCPTGQVDLLVNMDAETVRRIETDRGIDLRGPGLYIVDYKTAAARASDMSSRADYTQTVQAMTYPVLWNLSGGQGVKGMLFEVLVKHKHLGANSMQTFFSAHDPQHFDIVRNAVRIARASKLRGRANPYACYHKGYECYFLKNNQCSRM